MASRRALIALAALLFGAIQSPALAQTGPATPASGDPTGTLVSELVVNARSAGPAWWRVSKGEAIVYVMGVPGVTPKAVAFDDAMLRRRLDGANRLILAQEPAVSPFSLARFMLQLKRLKAAQPLPSILPAATVKRLHAILSVQGDPPDDLDDANPAFAGFSLANDSGSNVAIGLGGVNAYVRALAGSSALKVKPRVVSTGGYDVLGQIIALNTLPQDQQIACFDDGLRAAEAGSGGAAGVFAAWSQGRVRDVVQADRGFEACLARSPGGARALRRRMEASVKAIDEALHQPGLSIALVELRPLLAEGGVLEQLKARGYEVRPPGA